MAIRIVGNGWNVVSTQSTQALAEQVYEIFAQFIGHDLEDDIIVNNDPHLGHPVAHFEQNNGHWEITLSAKNGGYWAQIAYQLAHEICHLYCNHAQSHGHKHKWLEESFCECASIAVLDKLAHDWNQTRMFAFSNDYGPKLAGYIKDVKDEVLQPVNNLVEFHVWLSGKIAQLEKDSELRDFNRLVALYLYTSTLQNHSANWLAITSLNTWDCHQDLAFTDFIGSWSAASTVNEKETKNLIALLS